MNCAQFNRAAAPSAIGYRIKCPSRLKCVISRPSLSGPCASSIEIPLSSITDNCSTPAPSATGTVSFSIRCTCGVQK